MDSLRDDHGQLKYIHFGGGGGGGCRGVSGGIHVHESISTLLCMYTTN